MTHFLKSYKSPTNIDFPTESHQLCLEVEMRVRFFSTLTSEQGVEKGCEIVKTIRVDWDEDALKLVQGFPVDVLWIFEKE